MTIDFETYFRNRIENMLIRASWVSDIRRMLGLQGISQIWSSNPQWYFWLQDAPGTYCLSFMEGDVVHADGNDLYEGRFALKCYPHVDTAGYAGYAAEERLLRWSDHFDSTGTPCFESAATLSNSLFVIGSITFLSDPQGSFALLTFESLDALKMLKIEASQCGSHFCTSITRNVPGWEHGSPLFDCLVGLYAYCFHQAPIFMGATSSRGFKFIVFPDRSGEYRADAETTRLALTIGFGAPEGKAYARAEALWKMNLEPGEEIADAPLNPALDQRPKYVRSAEEGLWGMPTVLNNVETWCNIPLIIENGAQWYTGLGVPHSTGTKVFSLVGKVNNVGLVEVPMGMPLVDLIEKIGGGVPGQGHFKAVQTGGPSGGCIPYALGDISVDFDALTQAGSMMGSGGMIVMDDRDCVVDVARYFLRFLEEESCGKCLPCRLGLQSMLHFLDAFAHGRGSVHDIKELESLAKAVQQGSLCVLGGSAPNPVLTTLQYFRDEYETHILGHKCPAGVCKDLITYSIDAEVCTGCRTCAAACPRQCISGKKKEAHTIDATQCIRCGMCIEFCKFDAIIVE